MSSLSECIFFSVAQMLASDKWWRASNLGWIKEGAARKYKWMLFAQSHYTERPIQFVRGVVRWDGQPGGSNSSTGTTKSIKEYREKTNNNGCFIGIRTVTCPARCFYFRFFFVLFPVLLLPLLLVPQTNCAHLNLIKLVSYLSPGSSVFHCVNVRVQPFLSVSLWIPLIVFPVVFAPSKSLWFLFIFWISLT